MSKALESGKTFLDAVLAKLPESLRADAAKAFAAPEAADALTLMGDGVLARSDYSKQMDAIKEKESQITEDYTKLNQWYTDNKAALDKVSTYEAEIARLSGTKPTPTEPVKPVLAGMTKEDFDKILLERDRGYASVLATTTMMATKHVRDFNEILDVNDLVQIATQKGISLVDAYQTKFAEKLAAKAKAEDDARINKQVEERLAEERKKLVESPYPLRNASPSVLDVLESPTDKPINHTVDTALAEYDRLVAARG